MIGLQFFSLRDPLGKMMVTQKDTRRTLGGKRDPFLPR
jgi:hypothetical protein